MEKLYVLTMGHPDEIATLTIERLTATEVFTKCGSMEAEGWWWIDTVTQAEYNQIKRMCGE